MTSSSSSSSLSTGTASSSPYALPTSGVPPITSASTTADVQPVLHSDINLYPDVSSGGSGSTSPCVRKYPDHKTFPDSPRPFRRRFVFAAGPRPSVLPNKHTTMTKPPRGSCYTCGDPTHRRNKCHHVGKKSKFNPHGYPKGHCYNCGLKGHTRGMCPQLSPSRPVRVHTARGSQRQRTALKQRVQSARKTQPVTVTSQRIRQPAPSKHTSTIFQMHPRVAFRDPDGKVLAYHATDVSPLARERRISSKFHLHFLLFSHIYFGYVRMFHAQALGLPPRKV